MVSLLNVTVTVGSVLVLKPGGELVDGFTSYKASNER
jgi:hypothetical protein